jgi:DNA-binding NarL/FixJ family response regulator
MADEKSLDRAFILLRVLVADSGSSVNDGLTALLSDIDGISVFGCVQEDAKILTLAQTLRPDVVILDVQRTEPINLDNLARIKALPGSIVIALCDDECVPLKGALVASGADHALLRTDSEGLVSLINGMIAERRDDHGRASSPRR